MKIIINESQYNNLFENNTSVNYDEFADLLVDYHHSGDLNFNPEKITDNNLRVIFESMLKIIDELKKYGIKSDDYLNVDNIGYNSKKNLCYFDIGFGDYNEDFDKSPEEMSLNELDLKMDENILSKIFKKYTNNEVKFLGGENSGFGSAYDLGNNQVLKITIDKTEAINSKKLVGKETDHLAFIYDVKYIKYSDRLLYLIHMEKLKIDPSMRSKWVKINDIVLEGMNTNFDRNIIQLIGKKNPVVAEFLEYICNNGRDKAWKEYMYMVKDFPQYDFNDISDLSTWINGSVTNDHFIDDEPPEDMVNLVKTLI